jgi:hypothetical protein
MPYRELESDKILATLQALQRRIEERFPGAGLGNVASELRRLGGETQELSRELGRPLWPVRIGAGLAIFVLVALVAGALLTLRLRADVSGFADFFQTTEAVISEMVFLGIAVFFLVSVEGRIKRHRSLAALHRLRSVAHIVDMHQLTKDPERLLLPQPDTASSPQRSLTPAELGRYLDYCSELLSVTAKLAALHVQQFSDPVVLAAVNDIEALTTSLSAKIWQKITLLSQPLAARSVK